MQAKNVKWFHKRMEEKQVIEKKQRKKNDFNSRLVTIRRSAYESLVAITALCILLHIHFCNSFIRSTTNEKKW